VNLLSTPSPLPASCHGAAATAAVSDVAVKHTELGSGNPVARNAGY
jgi:hypothetical protein